MIIPVSAIVLAFASMLTALAGPAGRYVPAAAYDPLAADAANPATHDLVINDAARSRKIPVLVYLPARVTPAPVVLFSHGLGGSRAMSAYLGLHWARRSYVAIFLQHPGSDADLWQGKPPRRGLSGLVTAASVQNFLARVQDVDAVLDQLATWQSERGHVLNGRLDLDRIGMSGHSFGAITTQAVSGERFASGTITADPRVKAALPMSPSPPQRGSATDAFRTVRIACQKGRQR